MNRITYLFIFSFIIVTSNFTFDSDLYAEPEMSSQSDLSGDKKLKKATKRVNRKKNRKKIMRSLKVNNPELFAKFRAEKKKWKGLSTEDRKKARRAFMDANPELRKLLDSAGKTRVMNAKNRLKNLKPEQAKKLHDAKQSWQNLSREDRKKARKDFMKNNPEIRKSLRKFSKKRRKKSKTVESDVENSF